MDTSPMLRPCRLMPMGAWLADRTLARRMLVSALATPPFFLFSVGLTRGAFLHSAGTA
jgi:hypothetical protein